MSTIFISPTSAASSGFSWTNNDGVFGPDTAPATTTVTGTATSGTITFGNFPSNPIPNGSTIQGIEFTGDAWANNAGDIQAYGISLNINGHASGNLDSTSILSTTTGGSLSYGSPTTQPGTLSVSAADINTGSITGSLQFVGTATNSGSMVSASSWGLTIFYTPPPPPPPIVYVGNPDNHLRFLNG